MYKQQKAFSFVELIIVLAIILLLSVIVMTNIGNKKQEANNTKLKSDLITISNALEQYKSETWLLPTPSWNNNYFKWDSSYAHSWSSDAFWVYGSFP